MMQSGLFTAFSVSMVLIGTGVLISCEQSSHDEIVRQPDPNPTSPTQVTTLDGQAAMPVGDLESVKERMSREEWAEATEGISFDRGVVVVRNPPASTDDAGADALIVEANQAFQQGRHMDSIKLFVAAVQASPERIEAYRGMARSLIAEGKLVEAEAAHATVLELAPRNIESLFEMAMFAGRRADHAQAIERMQNLLDLEPAHGAAHERLAIWHYYLHDFDAAWHHVDAARNAGVEVPGQFIKLLENAG